jgi:hypothetical protein
MTVSSLRITDKLSVPKIISTLNTVGRKKIPYFLNELLPNLVAEYNELRWTIRILIGR